MTSDWYNRLRNAKKSCMVDRNLKKIHYAFENGQEMVEEYNLDTNVVTRRAWKHKGELECQGEWDIEIGDPEPTFEKKDEEMIRESSNQPFVSRRITKLNLEWRIRNLPYPLNTYSVTVDNESNDSGCLVVRTTNKKYYKRLPVSDLNRLNITLEQENVSFTHKFNTLVISYKKPKKLLEFETTVWKEIVDNVKPKDIVPLSPNSPPNLDGCKAS
ncbi:unnamed protein product [Acanthoscelides obtectus]|uniref:Protein DPCD n=1 Tax=Acanthoscelides obtectus TaxID=200917 RepID=A0A9P0M2E4_ACAOB|nr:unnamed protein product [Acanthoscelides obtectus]CAK1641570.1 Protein DPCD [Acanthoscelides obtectus]